MSITLTERLIGLARSFWGEVEPEESSGEKAAEDLLAQVDEARLEWLAAQSYFENVIDPALVDHAILSLQAAEKKYVYLLNLAKQSGLKREAYSSTALHKME